MILNEVSDSKRRRFSGRFESPLLEMDIQPEDVEIPQIVEEQSNNKQIRRRSQRFIRPLAVEQKSKTRQFNDDELEKVKYLYLDKTVKKLSPALETIFEQPIRKHNETLFWSARKYRRFFNFDEGARNKRRSKKRSVKTNAMTAIHKKGKRKFSIEYVKKYLDAIQEF